MTEGGGGDAGGEEVGYSITHDIVFKYVPSAPSGHSSDASAPPEPPAIPQTGSHMEAFVVALVGAAVMMALMLVTGMFG